MTPSTTTAAEPRPSPEGSGLLSSGARAAEGSRREPLGSAAPLPADPLIAAARALSAMPTLRYAYITLDAFRWERGEERASGVTISFDSGDVLGLDAAASLLEPEPWRSTVNRLDYECGGRALASRCGLFQGVRLAVTGTREDMDTVDGVATAEAATVYDEAPVRPRSVA